MCGREVLVSESLAAAGLSALEGFGIIGGNAGFQPAGVRLGLPRKA